MKAKSIFAAFALGAAALVGCSTTNAQPALTLDVTTLNDSGVTGTVSLTPIDGGGTLLVIDVVPGDLPNMPAHIHPGTCADLVPQPTYALESVIDGHSRTELPVSREELLAGDQVVNMHFSNDQMGVYSACVALS